MGIVVRLPFVAPKRRPSRLQRSGRDIKQPWYIPTTALWQCRANKFQINVIKEVHMGECKLDIF